jgi:hypothetical protein
MFLRLHRFSSGLLDPGHGPRGISLARGQKGTNYTYTNVLSCEGMLLPQEKTMKFVVAGTLLASLLAPAQKETNELLTKLATASVDQKVV